MNHPVRVLLDANVLAPIIDDGKTFSFRQIAKSGKVVFYGFSIVRKELRAIPLHIKKDEKSFRGTILAYYDLLVKDHQFSLTASIELLAKEYESEYSGGISTKKLRHDFLIVACASFHHIDILLTDDQHSLSSELAVKAYEKVNARRNLRNPVFRTLHDFEASFRPV
jgi:hypothetical protein